MGTGRAPSCFYSQPQASVIVPQLEHPSPPRPPGPFDYDRQVTTVGVGMNSGAPFVTSGNPRQDENGGGPLVYALAEPLGVRATKVDYLFRGWTFLNGPSRRLSFSLRCSTQG